MIHASHVKLFTFRCKASDVQIFKLHRVDFASLTGDTSKMTVDVRQVQLGARLGML